MADLKFRPPKSTSKTVWEGVSEKIVKSIFLGRFSADFDVWVLKMCRRAFLTISSLQNVKKRFHEFLRAQIRFFRYFRCENVQKSMISNRRNGVRVSKNHENLKIEFIHFYVSQSRPESDANLKKMFCAWIMGVSTTF